MPRTKKTEENKATADIRKAAEMVVDAAEKAKDAAVDAAKDVTEKIVKRATCKTTLFIEMDELSVSAADIQTAVKKAVKDAGISAQDIKIYVNVNEKAAYYTVDGNAESSYRIDLASL